MMPNQKLWRRMKISAVSACPPKGGLHEGVSGEAAHRLHLVLDHGRDFGRLHALEIAGEAQDPVDELEADSPQKPLAEPALVGIDIELEEPVDDHEQQEHHTKASSMPSCRDRNPRRG